MKILHTTAGRPFPRAPRLMCARHAHRRTRQKTRPLAAARNKGTRAVPCPTYKSILFCAGIQTHIEIAPLPELHRGTRRYVHVQIIRRDTADGTRVTVETQKSSSNVLRFGGHVLPLHAQDRKTERMISAQFLYRIYFYFACKCEAGSRV